MKYHFNKETGRTGQCTAKVKCRLGLDESEHFETREEAKKAYETSMSSHTVSTLTRKKNSNTVNNETLNDKDNFPRSDADTYGDELLKPITIQNDVNLEQFYNRLVELQKFDTFGLNMYNIEPAEKEFVNAFTNGEIPDDVPVSLETKNVASVIHGIAQDCGYYAKITKLFAQSLKEMMVEDLDGREPIVLDPLAGKGYFVKAMREQNVKTIGSDNKSWGKVQTDDFIENMDAVESLHKHGTEITHLLISWAPISEKNGEDGVDKKLYDLVKEKFPHITIISIGEGSGGCTGTDKFWNTIREDEQVNKIDVEYDEYVNYYTTYGLRDFVSFVKQKNV